MTQPSSEPELRSRSFIRRPATRPRFDGIHFVVTFAGGNFAGQNLTNASFGEANRSSDVRGPEWGKSYEYGLLLYQSDGR